MMKKEAGMDFNRYHRKNTASCLSLPSNESRCEGGKGAYVQSLFFYVVSFVFYWFEVAEKFNLKWLFLCERINLN